MQRDQSPSGEILCNYQIVNPGDIIIRENDVVNLLYQFSFGAAYRTDRVLAATNPVQMKYTHQHTTVTVDTMPEAAETIVPMRTTVAKYHIRRSKPSMAVAFIATELTRETDAAVTQSHIALTRIEMGQDADNDRSSQELPLDGKFIYRAFAQFEAHG